ncbi:transcriptional regulator [Algicola sagamiensis]|uniref:transcriptional regulator n=1 Tax=Algicola sagamiensis TaxID=163869 RepID=UPI00036ADF6E|nr:transcriptional regulator [Algicola sagamiensis]
MAELSTESFSNQSDRLDFAFNETRKKIDPDGKMTAKQMYSFLELSQSTFSAYRNGSEPSATVLRKLSTPCGFNIHWLATGEGEIYTHEANIFAEKKALEALGKIKHITDGKNQIMVNPELLTGIALHDGLRFDTVLNNDMPTVASTNHMVLVDTNQQTGEGLFIIEYKHQRLLRRIQINSDQQYVLTADVGDTIVASPNDVKVLGKVIWRAGGI